MSSRILLLYRGPQKECKELFSSFVPAGLFNILKALLDSGFGAELHNLSAMGLEKLADFIRSHDFKTVLISSFFGNHIESFRLARLVKKANPRAVTVLGGPVSVLGRELLERVPEIDFVIHREGEETSVALLHCLRKGESYEAIPGLAYRKGSSVIINQAVPVREIDRFFYLPSQIRAYCHHVSPENFAVLITARGCPFTCNFCSSRALWSKRRRFHSTDNLVRYAADLRKTTGALYFSIRDDNFLSDKPRVMEFCRQLKKEKLHYLWNVQGSGHFIDPELAAALAEAGCDQVQIGIETASPRLLTFLNKKNNPSRIRAAIATLRANLIRPFGYFISGMDERPDEVGVTTGFMRDSGLMDGVLSPLVIYPGTPLAQQINPDSFFEPREILYYSKKSFDRYRNEYLAALDDARNRAFFTREELYADKQHRFLGNIARHFFFLQLGKPDQAQHQLNEIIRTEPHNPWPHYLSGELLAEMGREKAARGAYAKADRLLDGKNSEIRRKALA